jgi:hypothetical protein
MFWKNKLSNKKWKEALTPNFCNEGVGFKVYSRKKFRKEILTFVCLNTPQKNTNENS